MSAPRLWAWSSAHELDQQPAPRSRPNGRAYADRWVDRLLAREVGSLLAPADHDRDAVRRCRIATGKELAR